MKKIIFRIIAFALDLLLVSSIVIGISSIPGVNKNTAKLNHQYQLVNQSRDTYNDFKKNYSKYTDDSKITKEEYQEISEKYPDYQILFKDVEIGEDLKNKFIDSIPAKIDNQYREILTDYNYKIQKLNVSENIMAIVIYILYFGVLAYFLKGQTLFKRIFKLRVVNKDDVNKKVPLWNYIVRALLVCEIVLLATDLIFVLTLNKNAYITSSYWLSQVKYIYEMAFLIVLIIRDDQRSIHDLLLNTRVVRYDKEGKVIEEQLFALEEPKEVKEEPKKKTTSKSKTTTQTKQKKKKEVVKAEKVND